MYSEQDYIEKAKDGFGFGFNGKYGFRVLGRHSYSPSAFFKTIEEARAWFHKCREYWLEMDELSKDA